MTDTNKDREDALTRLQTLKEEHRKLDHMIEEMYARPYLTQEDQIRISELKKMKLKKKEEILITAEMLGVEP